MTNLIILYLVGAAFNFVVTYSMEAEFPSPTNYRYIFRCTLASFALWIIALIQEVGGIDGIQR